MTSEEAKKMLEAKLKCLIAETSGTNHDCNMQLCDGCSLNYEQGNMGNQKQALDLAIKALEQQTCEDCFTDDEKRMFLTSLAREMKICEQVDIEYPNAKIKLAPMIHSIKEKVLRSSLWKEVEE